MNVCFFGIYDPAYARNRVLKEGFERNGYTVVECRVDPQKYRGLSKYTELYKEYKKIAHVPFEHVIVCFPGQAVALFARVLFGKRIIFDAFLSLYDSGVWDRKVYARFGLRAFYSWFLDWASCAVASRVLLDTDAHIRYFNRTFGVPREKCIRVWIGADDTMFYPRTEIPEAETFTVHFHGTFIPLQGIRYIIEAANMLRDENIYFRIVGSGQESALVKKRAGELKLTNVEFTGKVPVESVPAYMARAHIVLGIFGDTQKTTRVIPNKVYEALAMGKAIITADTPAIRELPAAADALMLVPVADPSAIAEAIKTLKANPARRTALGIAARQLFEKELLPERIVGGLIAELEETHPSVLGIRSAA